MASRKRPRDSAKPDTPTNGLNSSLQEIDLQNGSNSSMEDSNGHSKTNGDSNTVDQSSFKYLSNRPVSWKKRAWKWKKTTNANANRMNYLFRRQKHMHDSEQNGKKSMV